MPRRLTLLVALVALAAAGCGGSGDDTDAPSASTVTEPAATTAEPPAATEPAEATDTPSAPRETPVAVAPEKRKLEREGFAVRDSGVDGIAGADGAIELPLKGGGALTIIAFDTREAAEKHAEQYRDLAEKYPDYFRVEIRDTTLYLGVAERPEKLTKTGFADAVDAASSSKN